MEFGKKNLVTILILIGTVVLAGIAVFTAVRLYQLRSVAPNAPSSQPGAAGQPCGGTANITCPATEQCIYSNGTTTPPFANADGICQAIPAASPTPAGALCTVSFTLSATSTPSGTPTPTPTPSPTPGTPNACGGSCGSDANCQSGMVCSIATGAVTGVCRNAQCLTDTDCVCGTATPIPTGTPIATVTPTPTPAPELPAAGVETPTIIGIVTGFILIVGAIILAI